MKRYNKKRIRQNSQKQSRSEVCSNPADIYGDFTAIDAGCPGFKKENVLGIDLPVWDIENLYGYTPRTTFYQDFSIADRFGINGIIETYEISVRDWNFSIEYMTELAMVLNWKIWEHSYGGNDTLQRLYHQLWDDIDVYIRSHFSEGDLDYYYRVID